MTTQIAENISSARDAYSNNTTGQVENIDLSSNSVAKETIDKANMHPFGDFDNAEIHSPIQIKKEIERSTDKQINRSRSLGQLWTKVDNLSTAATILSNVGGAFMQLCNFPDSVKNSFANIINNISNFSFIPYGLDGMKRAFLENKNPYMFLGFMLETSMVWMSDLKNKYLIRGAATGTDQIWVATENKLEEKDPIRFKNGKFQTWKDGFIETPKACIAMLKDIVKDPIKVLTTIDKEKGSKGYYALLSSMGSIASTLGYFLTGNEKIFGTMRDISGVLFDWEMLFHKKLIAKASGAMFITESVLDFMARFINQDNTRLFVNMFSHAFGRLALQLYKASNSDDQQDNFLTSVFYNSTQNKRVNNKATSLAV
jgi:hypothetical protein